jgi:lipopolysaccharide export LptBFGC system permease protein LptF
MNKIKNSILAQWLFKFGASIVITLVGFLLLTFFPRDADDKIVTPWITLSLGSAVFVFACLGFVIDAVRAIFTKKQP